MRVGALCAGIGGLELGLSLAGEDIELAWVADNDDHAAQVLAARFGAPNLGDITTIEDAPPVDLIVAGFPCQPISKAGRKKGISDDRWLIRDVVRIANDSGASRIYMENVPGVLTLAGGEPFRQVLTALAEGGFDARWTHLRACDVGAAHRRNRWFCLATANANSLAARRDPGATFGAQEHGGRARESESYRPSHGTHPAIAIANPYGSGLAWEEPEERRFMSTRRFGFGEYTRAVERWERIFGPAPEPLDVRRRLNPIFVEWVMGFPKGWVTDIVPRRTHSLRLLGNSVVPQAAAAAWKHLTD